MARPDYDPEIQDDGGACVSPRQLDVHTATEAASVLIGVPLLLWVATRDRKLNTGEKLALASFAVGAVAVDGWLWSRFRAAKARAERP